MGEGRIVPSEHLVPANLHRALLGVCSELHTVFRIWASRSVFAFQPSCSQWTKYLYFTSLHRAAFQCFECGRPDPWRAV